MKNKKKFFGIVVFLLVASIASFVILGSPMKENAAHPKEYTVEEFVSSVSFLNNYQSALSENSDMIRSYVSEYDAENLTYEEYMSIEAYIIFILENSPTDEELAIINSLMNEGHTIQTLSQIYEFYLTTNENIDIVYQIASLEDEYWGDNWIENAYNTITNDKHGVLVTEEVKAYLDGGLSLDDISYANILCRKGVYTIHEILEMKQNGMSWEYINKSVDALSRSEKSIKQDTIYVTDTADIFEENPMVAYELTNTFLKNNNSVSLSKINMENIDEIVEQIEENKSKAIISAVDEQLKTLGYPARYMTVAQTKEYEQINYEKANSFGINDKTIARLKSRGFSIGEIADAADAYDGKPLNFLEELKSRREA